MAVAVSLYEIILLVDYIHEGADFLTVYVSEILGKDIN